MGRHQIDSAYTEDRKGHAVAKIDIELEDAFFGASESVHSQSTGISHLRKAARVR
jgi:hypothetical protein